MTAQITPISEEAVRQIALQELNACLSAKETLLKEHSEAYKWLMASLLAINAGGLLKLSDFSSIGPTKSLVAAIAFVLGIISALSVAWLGQISTRKMIRPISEMIVFWTLVSATGDFSEDRLAELNSQVDSTTKYAFRARWIGWLAVISFCFAVATIICGQPMSVKATGLSNSMPDK